MSKANPTNLSELKDYIKAKLGYPIVSIEIDDDQLNIVIADTLEKFYEYNYDGSEEKFIEITIEATSVSNGEYVFDGSTDPDNIIAIKKVWGYDTIVEASLRGTTESFYQIMKNKEYKFDYNPYNNTLRIFDQLDTDRKFLIAYLVPINAESNPSVYNDKTVKQYATALAKVQWGTNLGKYGSVILPGDMELKGDDILTEGKEELERAEESMDSHSFPALPIIA